MYLSRRVALGRREDRGLVAKVIRDKALSKYAKFSDHSAWRRWVFWGGKWKAKNPKSFWGVKSKLSYIYKCIIYI